MRCEVVLVCGLFFGFFGFFDFFGFFGFFSFSFLGFFGFGFGMMPSAFIV